MYVWGADSARGGELAVGAVGPIIADHVETSDDAVRQDVIAR